MATTTQVIEDRTGRAQVHQGGRGWPPTSPLDAA